ncbi:hypothetical protein CSC62_17525 [Pseudoxanthomonas jiangsuensis]|nr:hypothetical protein CSC62_17525 [Pseudoxanthomonas jiangsuensis]
MSASNLRKGPRRVNGSRLWRHPFPLRGPLRMFESLPQLLSGTMERLRGRGGPRVPVNAAPPRPAATGGA